MEDASRGEAAGMFEVGNVVVDEVHDDRVGEIMSRADEDAGELGKVSYYFLRPLGGGCEWTAPPQYLRAATPYEILRAKNAAANRATESRPW